MVVAGCSSGGSGSSPSSSSSNEADRLRARDHRDHDHDRQPPAADRGGRARLRRDLARLERLLPVRQRARRHLRPQDRLQGTSTTSTTRPSPPPTSTSWCCRTTCTRSSTGWARPTHLAVVKYLNSSKVPDVFVASGCECWNASSTAPYTTGWQIDYVREGKILGNYIKQHFAGKKIGYFYQDDEFGQDGVKGLDVRDPQGSGRGPAELQPGQHQRRRRRWPRSRRPGPRSSCRSRVPAFTALLKLTSLKLQLQPAARGQRRGLRPDHAGRAAGGVRQDKAGPRCPATADPGHHHRRLPALARRTAATAGSSCSRRSTASTSPKLPLDGNVAFGLAVALHVRPGHAQGRAVTRPGRT